MQVCFAIVIATNLKVLYEQCPILLDHVYERFEKLFTLVRGYLSHQSVVQNTHLTIVGSQKITRVGIHVKESGLEQLL